MGLKEEEYRLLIVDDDNEVREGLTRIVDWKRCGFQVTAALKDGSEGIAYLEQHPVDVVLSDIRMTSVSGLSLAKHVYEKKLPVKVVLISGYQEFELAKEALRYNVHDYLLKPTDLDEVYRVFHSLKEELDDERSDLKRQAQTKEMWNQMMRYLKERYLPHLLFETLADEDEIRHQFEMIGMNVDPKECACAVVHLTWSTASPSEYVQRALLHNLSEDASTLILLPMYPAEHSLQLLALSDASDRSELKDELNRLVNQASSRLHSLVGMKLEWRIELFHPTLAEFLKEHRSRRNRLTRMTGGELRQWMDTKQRWISCVENGNFEEAGRLLEEVLSADGGDRIDDVKPLVIQLFGSLDAVYADEGGSARLMQLCRSDQSEEIRRISLELLREMSRKESGGRPESERKVISQAKQYVRERAGEDISLSEVANAVYLNPVYLSRLFKLETGRSFSEYVTEVRMEQAARLLEQTNLRIYEICEKVGYKDVRHFYKLFKRFANCSPSEYREKSGRGGVD